VVVSVILLWLWQDMYYTVTVHTIPYSQFKTLLAQGKVVSCEVEDTEIDGKSTIDPTTKFPPEIQAPETAPSDKTKPTEPPTQPADKGGAAAGGATKSPPPSATTPAKVEPGAPRAAQPKVEPSPPAVIGAKPEVPTAKASPKVDGKTTAEGTAAAAKAGEDASTDDHLFVFRAVRIEDPKLVDELQAHGVKFAGVRPSFLSNLMLSWVLPLGIMFLLWTFIARRLGAAGQAVMRIGKSNARMVADKETGVTFGDVAGCDEAKFELEEVVDFLKNPKRYVALGAKIPKGVLLVGPPGTGKTLLARAVAGEAHVPFFSLSGSDFVEMFVGVGASRVRDLFEQAKAQAPCIVFIDELDAIGRERGVHVGPVNDEREQTLNQLLVEMDGFEANAGVILLAATNRPEVLDRALLRPGRFDRQVVVDSPDIDGREAILKVHVRKVPMAPDVDLRKLAQGTPGFSGADLANVINEAALLAARRSGHDVTQRDLEDAVEKVVAGPERRSRRLNDDEKRRVAFHETGHALVGAYSEYADPIQKISIVPRGRAALGYTLQIPAEQQFLLTKSALIDRLKGLLGGRAAEQIVFDEVSTGAENDLQRATALARQMICMYGMSDAIGLVHCAERRSFYVPGDDGNLQRDCSEDTARRIDTEVKVLLDSAYAEAKNILETHRDQLDLVAGALLERESLDSTAFYRLIDREPKSKPLPAAILP
jgi:cell division protease FtsH